MSSIPQALPAAASPAKVPADSSLGAGRGAGLRGTVGRGICHVPGGGGVLEAGGVGVLMP